MKTKTRIAIFAIVVLLAIGLSSLLAACYPLDSMPGASQQVVNESGLTYSIVIIEGMTCIYYQRERGEEGYAGLTCNWDEWRKSGG